MARLHLKGTEDLETSFGERGRAIRERLESAAAKGERINCGGCGKSVRAGGIFCFGNQDEGGTIYEWCPTCAATNAVLLVTNMPLTMQRAVLSKIMDETKFFALFERAPEWDSSIYAIPKGEDVLDVFINVGIDREREVQAMNDQIISNAFADALSGLMGGANLDLMFGNMRA